MTLEPTLLDGVVVVKSHVATDVRGCFSKQFNADVFTTAGFHGTWAEAYWSRSWKGVVRGMHFQSPPSDHSKLVTCVYGSVIDVAIDLRRSSPYLWTLGR